MKIKTFLLSLFQKFIAIVDKYSERKGLKAYARRMIIYLFTLIASFLFVTFFYLLLYILFIPPVNQTTRLNLLRTEQGYSARLLNFDHTFPTCRIQKLQAENETEIDKIHKKICIDPFNIVNHDMTFHPETYFMKTVLNMPNNENNNNLGIVTVKAELINRKHEIIELFSIGNLQLKSPGILRKAFDKLFTILGFSPSNRDVEIILSEKFANDAFEISVINIEITEPKLLLNSANLEMKVLLRGVRRILFEWFWISFITIIFWVSITLYVVLIKGIGIVDLIESRASSPREVEESKQSNINETLSTEKKTAQLHNIQFKYKKSKVD